MGRTSTFSFPLPGRRRAANDTSLKEQPTHPGSRLSKAQRLLGTDSHLNIDSPTKNKDVNGLHHPVRRVPSSISIAISESTQNDDGGYSSIAESFDGKSVAPSHQQLRGKASSTLLGHRSNDDFVTQIGSVAGRLRSQPSSSTIRSFYDRQNTPLSISQQTSASSARDLALRKGFPPVAQSTNSPLSEVESQSFADGKRPNSRHRQTLGPIDSKKLARLDVSRLFAKSKREPGHPLSPEDLTYSHAMSTASEQRGPQKLSKKESRGKQQSSQTSPVQNRSIGRTAQLSDAKALRHLYKHYESHPQLNPDELVAESEDEELQNSDFHKTAFTEMHTGAGEPRSPVNTAPFSWKNVRASINPPSWDAKSVASNSSRNTKASKRSVFSNSDLRTISVLSLSSDEDMDGVHEKGASTRRPANAQHVKSHGSSRDPHGQITQPNEFLGNCPNSGKKSSTHSSGRHDTYLTVPLPSPGKSRLSGPWASEGSRRGSSAASYKEESLSVALGGGLQPSNSSRSRSVIETNVTNETSGRLMAVTKQEEALLEALRQKRARMRENIIAELEIGKSPHRGSVASCMTDSTISTAPGMSRDGKPRERILLYLDTPISEEHIIETAEPSPDLSDFLSFGSDEEDDAITPRSSWVPSADIPRPDSSIDVDSDGRSSPVIPHNGLRLSALGPSGVLLNERNVGRKRANGDGSFLDTGRHQPFVKEEEEAVWGLE